MENKGLENLLKNISQDYKIYNSIIFSEYGLVVASNLEEKIDKETFGITMATTFTAAETAMEETREKIKRIIVESHDTNWILCRINPENLIGMAVESSSIIIEDMEEIITKIVNLL